MAIKHELMNGEHIIYETRTSFPMGYYFTAIILSFIPPFIWGITMLTLAYWRNKSKGNNVILTNQRLIISGVGKKLSAIYFLHDIKSITIGGFGIFGATKVLIYLRGKMLVRTVPPVREARTLVAKVQTLIKEDAAPALA